MMQSLFGLNKGAMGKEREKKRSCSCKEAYNSSNNYKK
jgi:hypothetical protein